MIDPPSAYLRNPRLNFDVKHSFQYTPKKNVSKEMDLPSRNKPFKKNEIKTSPLIFQIFLGTVRIDQDFIYFFSPISKSGT
jgi:hypothetical protein